MSQQLLCELGKSGHAATKEAPASGKGAMDLRVRRRLAENQRLTAAVADRWN